MSFYSLLFSHVLNLASLCAELLLLWVIYDEAAPFPDNWAQTMRKTAPLKFTTDISLKVSKGACNFKSNTKHFLFFPHFRVQLALAKPDSLAVSALEQFSVNNWSNKIQQESPQTPPDIYFLCLTLPWISSGKLQSKNTKPHIWTHASPPVFYTNGISSGQAVPDSHSSKCRHLWF